MATAMKSPSDEAEENRRRFPQAAAFVDAVRELWPEAKVVRLGPPLRSDPEPAADDPDGQAHGGGDLIDG